MPGPSSPAKPVSKLSCPAISASELIERYECLLVDAYGVLVDASSALPGASDFLEAITRAERDFLVVTNDASKLPETASQRYKALGLQVEPEQIVTSGALLRAYFASAKLDGARCMVLGPEDSFEYVRRAGGKPIPVTSTAQVDAVVVCDDAGYPLLQSLDTVVTALFRHFDRGDTPALVLPNPDLLYPKGRGEFGFTSGGVAFLIEAALAQRYPAERPGFVRLGKPFGPIFREALRRAATDSVVMVGDQIDTDIIGARTAGIDAAFVDTGVTNWERTVLDESRAPTYLLSGLTDR